MIRFAKDFFRYRELIEILASREIKIRYKQSVLGILWALFQPAMMMVLFTAIFTKVVRMPTGNIPYPLFFLVGLIPWTFFSTAITSALSSIVTNTDLVRKIYFPRVIFPLVSILAASLDFFVALGLLAVLMVYFKISLSLWILLLPVIFLIQLALMVGVSLIFSVLNVFYRDVKNAIGSIIQIWMFATPIIYPLDVIRPHLRNILLLNPMTGIVDSYRKILIEGIAPNWIYVACSVGLTLIVFVTGYFVFKKLEPHIADSI